MDQKLTEYFQRFPIKDLDRYDLSEAVYVNSGTKFKGICPEHGEFLLVPSRIKKLSEDGLTLCARCNKNGAGSSQRMDNEEFIRRCKETHGDKYDYSKTAYLSSASKVVVTCKEHGDFHPLPQNHMRGSGCPECGKILNNVGNVKARIGNEEFIRRSKEIFGEDTYEYDKVEYKSNKEKVTLRCKIHGEFTTIPNNHLSAKRPSGCPSCGVEKAHAPFRRPEEEVLRDILNKVPHELSGVELVDYSGNKSIARLVCSTHGPWEIRINTLLTYEDSYQGCPLCSLAGRSKEELDIADWIRTIYSGEVMNGENTLIYPKSLDIYLPEKRLAIEYNGLYWHSEDMGKSSRYHLNKTLECAEKNVRLIHIFEDEWKHNQQAVKQRLQHILGGTAERVGARKLKVSSISSNDAMEFLQGIHLQGRGPSCRFNFGLIDRQNELVAVMTINPVRFEQDDNQEGKYELMRFASTKSIPGGFSKLLSFAKKQISDLSSLISYSDKRWSDGEVYKAAGFKYAGTSDPGYSYAQFQLGIRRNRIIFQHHKGEENVRKGLFKSFDPSLSEVENCRKNRWFRIWDCGTDKWVMDV